MENECISDVDSFVEESKKGRGIPLSKEDIKWINDLSREVENKELKEFKESKVRMKEPTEL